MDHEANVQLYPEEEEPINILNIKRGIVSALLVPLSEEQEEEQQEEQRSSIMVSFAQVNRSREHHSYTVQLRTVSSSIIYNVDLEEMAGDKE